MKCPKPKKLIYLFVCLSLGFSVFNPSQATSTPTPLVYPTTQGAGTDVGFKIDAVVGSMRLIGYTSPNSVVTFMIENTVAGTQIACPGGDPVLCNSQLPGYFDKTFTGLYPGLYNIGIYSTDTSSPNLSTPTVSRQFVILQGQAATPDLLTLPPTIKVQKATMKRPETQSVEGMGRPNSNVQSQFGSSANLSASSTQNDGTWSATSQEILHLGNNFAYSFIQGSGGAISQNSRIVTFTVQMSADLNLDSWVDIADFSILMFNYGQTNPDNWAADINDDGFIDLSDFSIMMFNWNPDPGAIPTTTPTPTPTDTPTPTPTP